MFSQSYCNVVCIMLYAFNVKCSRLNLQQVIFRDVAMTRNLVSSLKAFNRDRIASKIFYLYRFSHYWPHHSMHPFY